VCSDNARVFLFDVHQDFNVFFSLVVDPEQLNVRVLLECPEVSVPGVQHKLVLGECKRPLESVSALRGVYVGA